MLMAAIVMAALLIYLAIFMMAWIIGIEKMESLEKFISASSGVMISLLIIAGAAFTIAFLVMFVCWLCKDEGGIMILPFEVAEGEEKYSGKAVSHLLTAELQRIEQINKIEIRPIHEPMGAPIKGFISEKSGYIPSSAITSGNLAYSLPNLGTVGLGTNSISINQLLIALKILWPFGETGQIITGALQKYGSTTNLIAFLEHNDVLLSWEVSNEIDDENIPDLVRDISYKIIKDLVPDDHIKSWLTFKYFTEAIYHYHEYRTTKKITQLERAGDNCLNAIELENDYNILNILSNELGFSWYIKGNDNLGEGKTKEALECYDKAFKFGACTFYDEKTRTHHGLGEEYLSNLYHNYGHVLMLMGDIQGSLESHDWAVKFDKKNAYAWNDKGTVHRIMGEHEKAIECYKEAIKNRPIFSTAYTSLASVYRKLGNEDERIETCKKARDFLTMPGNEFNHACFEAVCGTPDAALSLLRIALEKKQAPADWARRDPDLEFIRDDPRFSALLDEFSTDGKKGPK
jgi:tetratricopeptide (TPR) repeat protein